VKPEVWHDFPDKSTGRAGTINLTPQPDDIRTFFSRGIEQNMDALFGVAMRLTQNTADAEDLVAESVEKAWSAIESLADHDRFRPWLFRILRNSFISKYRKQSQRPVEVSYEEPFVDEGESDLASWLIEQPEGFLSWWADPEKEALNDALGEQIMTAIAELPQAFQTTVLLINVEGLTYDEAAEVLGIPTGTVRSRMKRGRALLQKALWLQAREAGLTVAESTNQDKP